MLKTEGCILATARRSSGDVTARTRQPRTTMLSVLGLGVPDIVLCPYLTQNIEWRHYTGYAACESAEWHCWEDMSVTKSPLGIATWEDNIKTDLKKKWNAVWNELTEDWVHFLDFMARVMNIQVPRTSYYAGTPKPFTLKTFLWVRPFCLLPFQWIPHAASDSGLHLKERLLPPFSSLLRPSFIPRFRLSAMTQFRALVQQIPPRPRITKLGKLCSQRGSEVATQQCKGITVIMKFSLCWQNPEAPRY
jgi:hypothetical protein